MFALLNRAGRLVECSLESPVTNQDAEGVGAELKRLLGAVPAGQKIVVATDLVLTRTLAPDVAERFIGLMRADNPRVERSGFLIADNAATFALQLERMIKEANHPSRRVFRRADIWQAWLAEVLSKEEAERLSRFAQERASVARARG
jgi:hypothetical protein